MPPVQTIKSGTPPKAWPKSCQTTYIYEPIYSATLDAKTLSNFHSQPFGNSKDSTLLKNPPSGPSALVTIKQITNSPSHPANNQYGLFATRKLPPGSLILFYLGHVHPFSESDLASNYDLSMDSELRIAVDGAKFGNEGRFINDFRGIGERANAEFRDVWLTTSKGTVERRMGVFVTGGKKSLGVAKGEEILVSYGKGFWGARG
jgi:hypothetical protein